MFTSLTPSPQIYSFFDTLRVLIVLALPIPAIPDDTTKYLSGIFSCIERNIPYYPGCVTPTEIMAALELGITTVKFFPANVYGGLKALKALSAPFPQVTFIPTGGVDRSNIDEFLAFDKIVAIGGSFFVKESLDKMEAK